MTQRAMVSGVVILAMASAEWALAVSGTWTGAASAAWTNSANWTGSTHPGNGTLQTATLDGAGNGNTLLDLTGLASIRNVVFTNGNIAAYALGAGGPNGQTLVLEGSGQITMDSTVAATQRVDAALQLHSSTAASAHTLRNDSLSHPLVVAGNLTGAPSGGTPGTKTLTVRGEGDTFLGGNISAGGATSVKLVSSCTGSLTLAGCNTFDSDSEYYSGTLRLAHPQAFAGAGRLLVRTPPPGGIIEFAYDGDPATPFNLAIGNYNSLWNIATLVSGAGSDGVGRNYKIGKVEISGTALSFARSDKVVSGTPSITVQTVDLNGSGSVCTFAPTTADLYIDDVTLSANGQPKTLVLDGTAAGSRVDGVISNGIHTVSVVKSNSGTWALLGANAYTGTTTVAGGTLALAGADGTIRTTADITIAAGGTLRVDNAAVANPDRLGDAAPVALAGGTLHFVPRAGAEDTRESAGALVVSSGRGAVVSGQADGGQTSALTFQSLVYSGGTVNFEGEGLGEDGRNQILFATPPTLSGGIIGLWATVNGTNLATYGANGIVAYALAAPADIAARGPASVIPNDAYAHVRIVDDGTGGPITLVEADTGVATLTQSNSTITAVVETAAKTFRTGSLAINSGAAGLTIGQSVSEGTLTAAVPGGVLMLSNDSGSPLTVNAAVADNGAPSAVSKFGSGMVALNGPCTYTGPTAINGGALVFGGHAVAQTVAGAIGGPGALVKNGTNLLHLLSANSYTGATTISAGVVRANTGQAFGDTTEGEVSIAPGATLDIGCTPDVGGTGSPDSLNFGTQLFTVSGAGQDGAGVIINNSNARQLNAFGRIALAGDATFGGLADWRLRNNTLTLNGHTLTKAGTNIVDLYNTAVIPGDGHIDVAAGTLQLLYDAQLNGSAANTLTVRSGAILQFYNFVQQNAPRWTMHCDDGAVLRVLNGTDGYNEWAGSVVLGGEVTLTAQSAYHHRFSGLISGSGPVNKISSATVYLLGTNNTYSGQTRISAGRIVAASLRDVGESGSLGRPATAADGAIVIGSGSTVGALEYIGEGDSTDRVLTMGGTTGAAVLYQNGTGPLTIKSALDASASGSKALIFRGDSAAPGEFAGDLSNAGGNVIRVNKEEAGTWVLSGSNTFTGPLTVNGGTLVLSGTNVLGGTLTNALGTLQLTGILNQGSAKCYIGGSSSGNAFLRLSDGANMTGTGNFNVGRDNGRCGAFHMEGGIFTRPTADDDSDLCAFAYSAGGYGYLKVSGGAFSSTRCQLGPTSGTTLGIGMARITGGTVTILGTFHISRNTNSVGVLTLDGGTLDHSNNSKFIQVGYRGGRGEINLTGGTLLNAGQTIYVRYSSGNSTGIVNLCAGALALDAFMKGSGATAWLTFRGGTLIATSNTTAFIPSSMSGVYSYGPLDSFAGGAVIDTAGRNVTVAKPIEAPGGNGVTAIGLLEQGSGYAGEPYVSITGGGGFGATAVANLADDGMGNGTYKVASITVTSPGCGYTAAPEVVLLRGGNGIVTSTVASVTLTPNTSGGLTKQGSGTLTLNAANTYTGATTVAGGTLKLGTSGTLPAESPVVLAGGTLDLSNKTVTNAVSGSGTLLSGTIQTELSPEGTGMVGTNTFTLSGGATLRANAYLADVDAQGGCDRVNVIGDIDLSGTTFTLVDPNQLDRHQQYSLLTCTGTRSGEMTATNLPERWRLVHRADGTVKLMFVDGTLVKVK